MTQKVQETRRNDLFGKAKTMDFNKMLHNFLGTISQTKLFGWLPLDILMHGIIGAIVTIVVQVYRKSHVQAFVVCLILALLKELFDSMSLTASWGEAIKDILVTMIYPTLLLGISTFMKKADRERV